MRFLPAMRFSHLHGPSVRRHQNPTLALALAHLDATNAQTLEWQCDVTRIAAPTGHESARAAWMAERFIAIGWPAVTIDPVGNLIARRRTGESSSVDAGAVWCCAHLDTVFTEPAPTVTQRDARLEGPGICDNGRGLAALLAIASAIHSTDLQTPREIVLACTVGEEGLGDLRGMKQLMAAAQRPHAVIAIDGAGDDRIVHEAVGSMRWRISFTGNGGHSWADVGVANPVQAAASVATALHAIQLPREPRTTLTVTRIGGGESINSIPRGAWLEVDARSLSATVMAFLERTVRETVARITRNENTRQHGDAAPLLSEMTPLGDRPCGALAADSPLVRSALAVTQECGIVPHLAAASTDASVPIALGIPAIAIGAGGRGGGMHTLNEWYDDSHGVRGLHRAMQIVVQAASTR